MRIAIRAALAASLLALGACNNNAPAPEASASSADASAQTDPLAPENAPDISVLEPVVKLPAVAGNPGVLYFTMTQSAGNPNTLAAVHVDGAGRAEMHESKTENGVSTMGTVQSVPFSKDKPAEFKAGGYHVMLFDIASTMKAGKDAEVTFTLANGDKVSAFATVEEAGGMSMMDHM